MATCRGVEGANCRSVPTPQQGGLPSKGVEVVAVNGSLMRLPGSLGTRGVRGALARATSIGRRYGWTPATMIGRVTDFARLCSDYGVRPTFPVVGSCRMPPDGGLARLQDEGVRFASHGLRHVDYTSLPHTHQADELRRSLEALRLGGLVVTSFRAPYLRTNADLRRAVAGVGLQLDSSRGVLWSLPDGREQAPLVREVVSFYGALDARQCPPLPSGDGPIEIPVSLPDDEMCVERLKLTPRAVGDQWCRNLAEAHEAGAIYVLQLHPERFHMLRAAAEAVLNAAQGRAPGLWLTTLDEAAGWWRRRSAARLEVKQHDSCRWVAHIAGCQEGRVETFGNGAPAASTCSVQTDQHIVLEQPLRPGIALSRRTPASVEAALCDEGFLVERVSGPDGHACHLDLGPESAQWPRAGILQAVRERASAKLCRIGRWPNGSRAAFCVTGDIDALSLRDFLTRLGG